MKKFKDSEAFKCRWAERASHLDEWDLIYDNSYNDYKGSVEFIVGNCGQYVYGCWSYGSCSGCDGYEDLSEDEMVEQFDNCNFEFFQDISALEMWVIYKGDKAIIKAMAEHRKIFDEKFLRDFESEKIN